MTTKPKTKPELTQTVPLTKEECEFLLWAIAGLSNTPHLDYPRLCEKLDWTLQ